jgi:polyisoprenoid-binding protein YceI
MSSDLASATDAAVPTGTWIVDPHHSTVGFAVRHMGIATVRGQFSEFDGRFEFGDDLASFSAGGTVKVASIDTRQPDRDAHLRSADFFDAQAYPDIVFESYRITPAGGGDYDVTGDLTIHGVTNPITLRVTLGGTGTDPEGNERLGIEATGEVSRADFGMTFNQALRGGGVLVGDTVKLTLDISALKQG